MFLACVALFSLSSFLCGIAPSLGLLIVFRVFQGMGGGAMQPISQAILLESFPPEKRGLAMGVFGMGVVVAPIIGPTLGGWLSDNFSWRWIFFINIPVGMLSLFLTSLFVFDPPYLANGRRRAASGSTISAWASSAWGWVACRYSWTRARRRTGSPRTSSWRRG